MINRVIVVVLDSLGIGALPDAETYQDAGADTLGHVCSAAGPEYALPHLASLGLSMVGQCQPQLQASAIRASYGKMSCRTPAKDTTAGHWELAGIVLEKPFPVFPGGFPLPLIARFEQAIGTRILGNRTASGTQIIQELGDEHCRTGFPIVYTSADSVFQVAAHEEHFGLDRLYAACRSARALLTGEYQVGRVIARPFTGTTGAYVRTANRRDFSVSPFSPTILDRVAAAGGAVVAIGKIEDIFNSHGITRAVHTHSNAEGMRALLSEVRNQSPVPGCGSLIFANLVDFDMQWGHRRDPAGYAAGLKAFDDFLPQLLDGLSGRDMLIITADHGCDPTHTRHTDHTREYVPLLVYGASVRPGVDLGIRASFADTAQTIADLFGLHAFETGASFAGTVQLV